jgi:hypothetical protein
MESDFINLHETKTPEDKLKLVIFWLECIRVRSESTGDPYLLSLAESALAVAKD